MIHENPLFQAGVLEFQTGEYYRCHDSLEAVWLETAESEKSFVQGILQIAVACYHLSNGNGRGAMILLGEGIKRLRDYLPEYETIDVSTLVNTSRNFLTLIQTLDPHNLLTLGQWIKDHGHTGQPWETPNGDRISLPTLRHVNLEKL